MNTIFQKLAFTPADILLPKNCDMQKWPVVACDQYTSEPEYWHKVEEIVGTAPSTLRLTLPEIYLKSGDLDDRIGAINSRMLAYLDGGLFETVAESFIYTERTLQNGKIRRGLVGAVDLEAYDFSKDSGSLIRATEGTVLDRIPPRAKVRAGAALELPHVMILIDDQNGSVIEPLTALKDELPKLYDTDLMQGGGHITGYRVNGGHLAPIAAALEALADPQAFKERYGFTEDLPLLLYAMGDGNHSLATAKECYNRLKAQIGDAALTHPARYALCELVNIHDSSLEFEPIHRVCFGVDPEQLLDALFARNPQAKFGEGPGHRIEFISKGKSGLITCDCPQFTLAVAMLQSFLDDYMAKNGGSVDYIHGDEVVRELGGKEGNIGFLLPAMGKSELFKSVASEGPLPRKTFSMGEAHDKRFYFESRKIR